MKILIKNGRVIDPANGRDEIADVLIGDRILSVEKNIAEGADKIINADSLWVTPGLIDIHTHLRDPGQLYKESIASGCAAAAAGGFTAIAAMPNTVPAADNEEVIRYVISRSNKINLCRVIPVGSVTKGRLGRELTDIKKIINAGAAALSEDGSSVADAALFFEALKVCAELNIPMLSHCEDPSFKDSPDLAEELFAARDIILAERAGARLHICHASAAGTVAILRNARSEKITAEAAPHHFVLSEDDFDGTDANYKMNPPLRSRRDVNEIIKALADGAIGVIASDHAPHHASEKNVPYGRAANGVVGLETTVPLCVSCLVKKNILKPAQLIEKLTINPARVLGLNAGTLSVGASADLTIIDPDEKFYIDKNKFYSMGKNTPFHGRGVCGRVKQTIFGGRIVFSHDEGGIQK